MTQGGETLTAEGARRRRYEDLFEFQCKAYRLPPSERHFPIPQSARPLDPRRRWYFDRAFEKERLLIEIDGGIWREGGGAHSHPKDIERNMTKQNDAVFAGWSVLRFTPAEVTSGEAIAFTLRMLNRIARAAAAHPDTAQPTEQPSLGMAPGRLNL